MFKDQVRVHKNGAWVFMGKLPVSGMYEVKVYRANGELIDKVRCDNYSSALTYRSAFNEIAKNS